jgi:hypothetical protein
LGLSLFYLAFGLRLQSDQPIPGLIPLPDLSGVDVEVCLGGFPPWLGDLTQAQPTLWYVSPILNRQGQPIVKVWQLDGEAYFWLSYDDGVEFVVDRPGARIWARCPPAAPPEDLAVYLLGPVLGFLLRLRGITCLHASAVEVDHQALALVGPQGAGKSTTAAGFAHLGLPVLADDVVTLCRQGDLFMVQPGYPRLRLWPQAVNHLYGSPEALPRLTPENSLDPAWDKRYLDLTGDGLRFQGQPLPLGAVYLLGERDESGPRVDAVSPGEGLMALVANTYRTELLDKAMRAEEFEVLARLVAQVTLRRVTPHPDPASLPRLCQVILEDFRALTRRAASSNEPQLE